MQPRLRVCVFPSEIELLNLKPSILHSTTQTGRFMKVARIMKLGKLGFIFDMLSDFFNISPKAGPVPLRVRPPMSVHLHSAATTRVTGFRDQGFGKGGS